MKGTPPHSPTLGSLRNPGYQVIIDHGFARGRGLISEIRDRNNERYRKIKASDICSDPRSALIFIIE